MIGTLLFPVAISFAAKDSKIQRRWKDADDLEIVAAEHASRFEQLGQLASALQRRRLVAAADVLAADPNLRHGRAADLLTKRVFPLGNGEISVEVELNEMVFALRAGGSERVLRRATVRAPRLRDHLQISNNKCEMRRQRWMMTFKLHMTNCKTFKKWHRVAIRTPHARICFQNGNGKKKCESL